MLEKYSNDHTYMHIYGMILDTPNMTELMTAILQRVGSEIDRNNLPQILVD